MEETGTGLWRQFPLLLPQNRARTVYEGFVTAQVLARRRFLARRTPVPRRGAAPWSLRAEAVGSPDFWG